MDHHSAISEAASGSGGSGILVTDVSYGFPSSVASGTFDLTGSSASSDTQGRTADGKQQQGGIGLQSRQQKIGSSVAKEGPGSTTGPTVVVANSAPADHGPAKESVAPVVENKDSRAKESDLRAKAVKKQSSERTPEHPIQHKTTIAKAMEDLRKKFKRNGDTDTPYCRHAE